MHAIYVVDGQYLVDNHDDHEQQCLVQNESMNDWKQHHPMDH